MIANDRFDGCFGVVPAGDSEHLVKVAVQAVRNGYALVFNEPGSKRPLCTLTARQAKQADQEAKDAAQEAGDTYWERRKHRCGIHHAVTDETEARRVATRLVKSYGHVNLGIEPGKSRMVAVDVDTVEEKEAFISAWSAAVGQDMSGQTPTVLSPGSMNVAADGSEEWAHRDGGHYWFYLPDGFELPTNVGSAKGDGGWVAMWRDKQVLVPPSVRAEGAYRLVGQPNDAPQWLLDFIIERAGCQADRVAEQRARAVLSDSPIDKWDANEPWDGFLEEDGWSKTGKMDRCGCPEWTAPGIHSNPKSTTAHEIGCDVYETTNGGPLHLWTDNVPDALVDLGKTVTKMRYVAATRYGGDIGSAMRGLGLSSSSPEESFPAFEPLFNTPSVSDCVSDTGTDTDEGTADEDVFDVFTEERYLSLPDPVELIEGLVADQSLVRIYGKSNHGKSFIALDMILHIATGKPWAGRHVEQGTVMYIPYEGLSGVKKRLQAWMEYHKVSSFNGAFLSPTSMVQIRASEEWGKLIRTVRKHRCKVVVIDTQSQATSGLDENSAQDMSTVLRMLNSMLKDAGASVWTIHHLGHNAEHARGSSVMLAGMDTELCVKKHDDGSHSVTATKQRDLDTDESRQLRFMRVKAASSAVMVAEEGDVDPLFNVPEVTEQSPLWCKLAKMMYETAPDDDGITRAEAVGSVLKEYKLPPSQKPNIYRSWRQLVDDGRIVETLNEKEQGTGRYVVGVATVRELSLRRRRDL